MAIVTTATWIFMWPIVRVLCGRDARGGIALDTELGPRVALAELGRGGVIGQMRRNGRPEERA